MNEKMDLCIYTWFGYDLPFDNVMKLIKNAGFQSVMTWWGDEYSDRDGPKEKIPEIIRSNNLKLENVHFPYDEINSIWKDIMEGQIFMEKIISYVEDCRKYDIPTAIIHVSSGDNPPPFNQLGLDRFKRIIEIAERNNINIALENLRKPEYLEFIYKNIQSNKLFFCYDSGHENCRTPNYIFLDKYKDKLIALHLHDNDGIDDQHLLPFDGTINWKAIMEKLKSINYRGSLAFEIAERKVNGLHKYSVEEYLSEVVKRAKRLLDMLV